MLLDFGALCLRNLRLSLLATNRWYAVLRRQSVILLARILYSLLFHLLVPHHSTCRSLYASDSAVDSTFDVTNDLLLARSIGGCRWVIGVHDGGVGPDCVCASVGISFEVGHVRVRHCDSSVGYSPGEMVTMGLKTSVQRDRSL